MTTSFQKLIDYLGTHRDQGPPTTTRFREFNVDEVASALHLDEKARDRAQAGPLPPGIPDEGELAILAYVREKARASTSEFHAALDTYESRLRDASIDEAAFVMIRAAGEEGISNFKAQTEEDRLPLRHAEDDAHRVIRQFEDFIRRNRLRNTAPIIVERRDRISATLWVAAIVVIESIVNGLFFATGSRTGLIGGITEALSLSFVNVALAAALGFFALRYIRHVNWAWKCAAGVSLILLLAMVVGLNGLIAHYREAFQQLATNAEFGTSPDFIRVMDSFFNRPLELQDAKSWLLGVVGIVMNAIAIWKFRSMNDPYPGFGSLAKRRRDALVRLHEKGQECIEVLTDHRDAATSQMANVIATLSAKKNEFEVVLRSRHRLARDFQEHIRLLAELCVRLGYRYRAVAGTDGPPLDAQLNSDFELSAVYTQDSTAHSRAIETMDAYLTAISTQYSKSVESVGAHSITDSLGAANA